ncbi:hypothetical protein [Dyadobacter sediminis]|uniref:Erythromycin esterase family protein n=1 Tax=Dyadobacter sediminis TaxID=1493691 RepID=A0A5R9KJN0_9BACT|nr:hypothetical protein [Dyadobacter sediminis]TLU96394.1 hypothetical protein FEM55_04465 [Dyadobacter sediminis]GGB81890.1 hypothetical protein GCM10011325_06700 [Dyadobacter sediminis]
MILKSKGYNILIAALYLLCSQAQLVASQPVTDESHPNDYYFSSRIFNSVKKDNYFLTSWQFSFIGDYQKAIQFADSSARMFPELAKKDSDYFRTFRPVAANGYIAERAANEQIVIINEAHHSPLHRVFTMSLLEDLYHCGYRYFGAETISFADSLLNERKYPLQSTGWYSVEPQYGELIRQALKIGFQVFDYEARTMEAFQDGKRREISQARHIQAVLAKDPQAKILIHAGFDHIREDQVGGSWGKAMAGRLKEFTGINPFTINQEMMTERSSAAYENPYYKMVAVDTSSLFVNNKNELFNGPPGAAARFDARLFHPRTKMIHGRPDWLYLNGRRKPFPVRAEEGRAVVPCLVFAYYLEEDHLSAVPADVIEMTDLKADNTLVLFPGKYRIIMRSENGIFQERIETIE